FFLAPTAPHPGLHSFPTRRSSDLFALLVDLALLTLGGNLKRREMISARFGDVLSELYLLSAVLKRWNEEGRQPADLPLVQWCMRSEEHTSELQSPCNLVCRLLLEK